VVEPYLSVFTYYTSTIRKCVCVALTNTIYPTNESVYVWPFRDLQKPRHPTNRTSQENEQKHGTNLQEA